MTAGWRAFIGPVMVLIAACNPTSSSDERRAASGAELSTSGFTGEIGGVTEGEVTGEGVLGAIQGLGGEYYYLSDGQGVRDFGVTFTLPKDVTLGSHKLSALDPASPHVGVTARVDQDTGSETVSWGREVSGSIVLHAIPEPGEIGVVEGKYNLSAANSVGDIVTAKGQFQFTVQIP